MEGEKENFHQIMQSKIDDYAHLVFKITRSFPSEEKYGCTSQLRRSALSVVLNYIEGFARFKYKVHRNFLEIAYGSLKESRYLLDFTKKEDFIKIEADYFKAIELADEIGAMLWKTMKSLPQ